MFWGGLERILTLNLKTGKYFSQKYVVLIFGLVNKKGTIYSYHFVCFKLAAINNKNHYCYKKQFSECATAFNIKYI